MSQSVVDAHTQRMSAILTRQRSNCESPGQGMSLLVQVSVGLEIMAVPPVTLCSLYLLFFCLHEREQKHR